VRLLRERCSCGGAFPIGWRAHVALGTARCWATVCLPESPLLSIVVTVKACVSGVHNPIGQLPKYAMEFILSSHAWAVIAHFHRSHRPLPQALSPPEFPSY